MVEKLEWEKVAEENAEREHRMERLTPWCRQWQVSFHRLARLMGVSFGAVQHWAYRRRRPSHPGVLLHVTQALEAEWRTAHPGVPDPGPVFYDPSCRGSTSSDQQTNRGAGAT